MQILHMVSHALSRGCASLDACRAFIVTGSEGSAASVNHELSVTFVCPAHFWCEPLKREKLHSDCVQMGPNLWLCWESALWSCAFIDFNHFFFGGGAKYKGIIIFSTAIIVQLYAVQLNPTYKYCVCVLYITLYTLKNETLMLFCHFSLDQKDVLKNATLRDCKRCFRANVAEDFTVFMWKMFVWTEWKKHSCGPYGRNWTQSAVGLTATWASFAWAPTL